MKAYVEAQWTKILANRISVADFIFAKEVCPAARCLPAKPASCGRERGLRPVTLSKALQSSAERTESHAAPTAAAGRADPGLDGTTRQQQQQQQQPTRPEREATAETLAHSLAPAACRPEIVHSSSSLGCLRG